MIRDRSRSGSNTIEIIGPPGIGKSVLFHAVCRSWNPKKEWVYDDVLLAPKEPSVLQFSNWLEYQYRWYLGKKLSRNLPNSYGEKFILNNEKLARFCWRYLSENPHHNSIKDRYRYSCFLFDNFCKYQAIEEKNSPKPCLIEEGFLQKSFLIHDDRQMMEEILDQYISLLPLPATIIALDTEDAELIAKRIQGRNKIIPSHYNMDLKGLVHETEKWQYYTRLVLDKMKKKDVPVYKIDGSKPLEEKAAVLNLILQSQTR